MTVPGGAARTKRTGTTASATICRFPDRVSASRVAGTPPSTEFSMGTTAASTSPLRTASNISFWLRMGTRSTVSRRSCSVRRSMSAASVKVAAGPR